MSYQIGQRVFKPRVGIGEVIDIVDATISGIDLQLMEVSFDKADYRLDNQRALARIPLNQAHKLLSPFPTQQEMLAALDALKKPTKLVTPMWSRRVRILDDLLKTGNFTSLIQVYNSVKRSDLPAGTPLSYSENLYLKEISVTLAMLVAHVFEIDTVTATKSILDIAKGVKTAKEALTFTPEKPAPKSKKPPKEKASISPPPVVETLAPEEVTAIGTSRHDLQSIPLKIIFNTVAPSSKAFLQSKLDITTLGDFNRLANNVNEIAKQYGISLQKAKDFRTDVLSAIDKLAVTIR